MVGFATYTAEDVARALSDVGVVPGDVIMLHSSLFHLGLFAGAELGDQPKAVFEAVRDCLGPEGTLALPAGFWDYGSKAEPYETRTSPVAKDLGVMPNYAVGRPDAKRSLNPLYAVVAFGEQADFITGGETGVAFGYDSPWERLGRLNAKNVFFGADIEALMYARLCEQHFGVPYIYNKLYDGPVNRDGKRMDVSVVTPVRYLNLEFDYDLSRLAAALRAKRHLPKASLGGGRVEMVTCADAYAAVMDGLRSDIHYLLDSPPDYVGGEIPFDVPNLDRTEE